MEEGNKYGSHPLINSISKIKGHRVFHDFAWPTGLHEFGRFNLFYGWNGSGKTTLANLFAKLDVHEDVTEGEVEFNIGSRCIQGKALSTNAGLPPIRVFVRDTASSAVYTGGTELKPIYYFGKQNVEAQKELISLKERLEPAKKECTGAQYKKSSIDHQLDQFCIDQASAIKTLLTGQGSAYNNYNKASFRQACGERANHSDAFTELSGDDKNRLIRVKESQARPIISTIHDEIPDLAAYTQDVIEVLGQTVVSQVIERLATHPQEASWVKQGLSLHEGDEHPVTCKFCGNIVTSERVRYLEGHFNDQYNSFMQRIDTSMKAIETADQQLTDIKTSDPAAFYDDLNNEYSLIRELFEKDVANIRAYLSALRDALSAKREKPFEAMAIVFFLEEKGAHDESTEISPAVETTIKILMSEKDDAGDIAAREHLDQINKIIEEHNRKTQNLDREKATARKQLENALVAEAYPRFQELSQTLSQAESNEKDAVAKIKQIADRIRALEHELIEHQTPADELTRELHSFLGRADLALTTHDAGYTVTRNGQSASHLSEGEKSAIVFLHFLKSLHDRSYDLKKSIVVIDDPICSLDSNALFSAFGYMKERTKDAGQLFILTHNFNFYRLVKNWFHNVNRRRENRVPSRCSRFFMLTRKPSSAGETAVIRQLPHLLEEHESEYHFIFKRLYEASQIQSTPDNLAEFYPLPNLARRLLETFMAFRYPADTGDLYAKLEKVTLQEDRKVPILRFLNTFSHAKQITGEEHDLSLLLETPQILKYILEFIRSEDLSHYTQMKEVARQSIGRDAKDYGEQSASN
jgi:wobble nucleotide-excising tRNase